jgi:hypothetical protein
VSAAFGLLDTVGVTTGVTGGVTEGVTEGDTEGDSEGDIVLLTPQARCPIFWAICSAMVYCPCRVKAASETR